MTKKEKKQFLIVAIIGVVIFLYSRSKKGKTIYVGVDFLTEAYYDLIKSDTIFDYEGEPLHIYLARNTYNFTAVADEYYSNYRENLIEGLVTKLTDAQLIAFNNAHYKATGVKIFNI